jgi:hypothetical protein
METSNTPCAREAGQVVIYLPRNHRPRRSHERPGATYFQPQSFRFTPMAPATPASPSHAPAAHKIPKGRLPDATYRHAD